MGCLLEFVFEVVFESVAELIVCAYISLVKLIVPDKVFTRQTTTTVRNAVVTVSVLLLISLVVGILCLLPPDPVINTVGRYMTYIPLGIIGVEIIAGVVMFVIRKRKK